MNELPLVQFSEINPEIKGEAFKVSEELQKAILTALTGIKDRSFSERHPELGKMVNCAICRTRHRVNERKCEQVFTYRIGDYELLRENDNGELVPDYRTCVSEGVKPTPRQTMGRAAFAKKRFRPHPSKIKLLFIERTRKIFSELEFALEKTENQTDKEFQEQFNENLQRARVLAARELRSERRLSSRATRIMQDTSRRINREA